MRMCLFMQQEICFFMQQQILNFWLLFHFVALLKWSQFSPASGF
jgi:hypothetical protein